MGKLVCRRCGSNKVAAAEKGYSTGKAALGFALVGPAGLLAGGIGSKKVRLLCLNCGYKWESNQDHNH